MRLRALLAALLLSACAAAETHEARETRLYGGVLSIGFEQVAFVADGAAEPWWASFEAETWQGAVAPLQTRCAMPWGAVHLIVEGEVSEPGQYGHLGAYKRELRVTSVRESRFMSCAQMPFRTPQ
jgi:hypothetical protein